jgi:acyl-CoA synthetase (AMP-forming)/AMP-acid ligase II
MSALAAPVTTTIPDLLHLLRCQPPQAQALTLVQGGAVALRWNFRELLGASARLRRTLQTQGLRPGMTVCVVADNSPQFVALFLACLELGCCFAPLHPDQRADSLPALLRELMPALLIVDEGVDSELLRCVRAAVPRVCRLRLREQPWLRPILGRTIRQHDSDKRPVVDSALPELALLLHSSGSTGAPKIITYTRERLNLFLHWQRRLFAAFPDLPDTQLPSPRVNALPLAHFGGLSFVLQGLIDGRAVHLARDVAPLAYLGLAVRARAWPLRRLAA